MYFCSAYTITTIILGDRIKKLSEERGLSQLEVADKLSINSIQYKRIESGKVAPSLSTLEKLAKVFGVFNSTDIALNLPLLEKKRLII